MSTTADITALLSDIDFNRKLTTLKRETGEANVVITDLADEIPTEFEFQSLLGTIFTSINGKGDIKEQKVRVEYLSRDQLLVLPAGLGISPVNEALSEATYDERYSMVYLKVARMTWEQIYNLVNAAGNVASKLTAYQAITVDVTTAAAPNWLSENFAVRANGTVDPPTTVDYVFSVLSRIHKMNCDIRDIGALVGMKLLMRLPDNAWDVTTPYPRDRFVSKLAPYTMNCIAALNMPPCRGFAIGAWTRAFGVSAGILPERNTALNKEYKYSHIAPLPANLHGVLAEHERLAGELNGLCLNLIAMFGLLHLNKNHTFITGEASMTRICTSYINTLRTMVSSAIIEDLKGNMEVTCRTAVHPFGLGQTYCVAKALHAIGGLASPLDLRHGVTPPLTQRLMIIQAAANEWETMPVGAIMTKFFAEPIKDIVAEIANIKQAPPMYSELYKYYGLASMMTVPDNVKDVADKMMPVVAGYANVMHVDDKDVKDGLALAMSFFNVNRDAKAATAAFTTMWSKYLDTLEERDLEDFMAQTVSKGGFARGAT